MTLAIRPAGAAPDLVRHAAETLRVGVPLAAAQLAQMAMGVTDTVLLGALSPEALAAGGLGSMLQVSVLLVLQGVLIAISTLVAQALGARRDHAVPAIYWSGVALTILLALPAVLLFGAAEGLLRRLGEPEPLVTTVGAFVGTLSWGVPGALFAMGLSRAFLPAVGAGRLILLVNLVAVPINFALCYGFIHGAQLGPLRLPALGVQGAALATVIVQSLMAVALLALTHADAARRALVRWHRPHLGVLATILRLGVPIGLTYAVETGLFFAVALIVGLLGPVTLAAHQVALTTISVAFMVPLGIAQAANVRVGLHVGAGDRAGARAAGVVAIALGAGFELACAGASLLVPERIVGLFLDAAEAPAFGLAVTLVRLAALFQVADGVQCIAAGALRGLGDTRVPFTLAALGYWGIGFPAAWALALPAGLGAPGAWWGLAAALGATAALLTLRFLRRSAAAPQP